MEEVRKEYKYCKRCNRELKSITARLLGYGPVCYKKMKKYEHNKKLF